MIIKHTADCSNIFDKLKNLKQPFLPILGQKKLQIVLRQMTKMPKTIYYDEELYSVVLNCLVSNACNSSFTKRKITVEILLADMSTLFEP